MLVTLDSITTKITKGTTPTSVGCTFENSGVNFIKSESLGNSRNIDRSKFAFISEQTHEKLKRSQIEKNDILFYGYLWNEARDQWLVDPEAADVVKRIFAMTIEAVSYTHLDVYKRQGQDNGERLATININHMNAVAIIYFKSNNILGIH